MCRARHSLLTLSRSNTHNNKMTTIAAATATPTVFRLMDLPTELRAMIWAFTIPGPRTIRITAMITRPGEMLPHIETDREFPVVLHVCQQSRNIGMKVFKEFFLPNPNMQNEYIDLACDTVYISNVATLSALLTPV